MNNKAPRCDIFCVVVDNYGDAAVCWRLARQLRCDYGWEVRLWIDDLAPLEKLTTADERSLIDIQRWVSEFPKTLPAEIVIEAFACELPPAYIASMASLSIKPVWLNLEYLSAEAWVDGCHGMTSRHPRLPLVKQFFFPGFTPDTGGLLREKDYATRQAKFDTAAFRAEFSLMEQPDALTLSLFSYANPALPKLIDAWSESETPVQVLCPGSAQPRQQIGNLELIPLPFLPQSRYDEMLWLCDLNFVRGEDSFVRAQWAGKPFVWQIYPQADDAHLPKLEAFIANFTKVGADDTAINKAMRNFWLAWNSQGPLDWTAFTYALPALQKQAANWANHLVKQRDLAANLVQFCLERLK